MSSGNTHLRACRDASLTLHHHLAFNVDISVANAKHTETVEMLKQLLTTDFRSKVLSTRLRLKEIRWKVPWVEDQSMLPNNKTHEGE